MADLIVVDELYAYLLEQRVGQAPDETPSATVPVIYCQPRQGAPEPRADNGENVAVSLFDTGLGGASPLESFIEEAFVDILVRASSPGHAQLTHRTIRGLLTPKDAVGGRKQWPMAALTVERSFLWRREQPIATTNTGLTYDRVQSFCFQMRVSALSLP